MKKILFLFGILASTVYAANPTYDATRGALQNNSALCGYGYNDNCSASGSGRYIIKKKVVKIPSKYSALALDKNLPNITGWLDADSKAEAEKKAITECEKIKGSSECQILAWAENGCVAASVGTIEKKFRFFGAGSNVPGKVESIVMSSCKKANAKNCKIAMPEGCSIP